MKRGTSRIATIINKTNNTTPSIVIYNKLHKIKRYKNFNKYIIGKKIIQWGETGKNYIMIKKSSL
jgi:hypothetical protein